MVIHAHSGRNRARTDAAAGPVCAKQTAQVEQEDTVGAQENASTLSGKRGKKEPKCTSKAAALNVLPIEVYDPIVRRPDLGPVVGGEHANVTLGGPAPLRFHMAPGQHLGLTTVTPGWPRVR